MQTLSNDIILRPRFQLEIEESKEQLLHTFNSSDTISFNVKRLGDHVFIKFKKKDIHFWSPQLHLEINESEKNKSKIYGLFGPNPTLWTFFMFLHFAVATTFIALSIWAYSSAALNKPYTLQLILMLLMTIFWFSFYAFGRAGKKKGKPQMRLLYDFMNNTLGIT